MTHSFAFKEKLLYTMTRKERRDCFAHRSCVYGTSDHETVDSVEDIDDTTIHQWNYRIKSIIDVLDEEPLINEELFKLAHEMARTCAAPLISCFQCMLPSKLKPKSSKQTLKKAGPSWPDSPKAEGPASLLSR